MCDGCIIAGDHRLLSLLFGPQILYTFSFWLMLRQQLQEIQEQKMMKAESLDEVKVLSCNFPPSHVLC